MDHPANRSRLNNLKNTLHNGKKLWKSLQFINMFSATECQMVKLMAGKGFFFFL